MLSEVHYSFYILLKNRITYMCYVWMMCSRRRALMGHSQWTRQRRSMARSSWGTSFSTTGASSTRDMWSSLTSPCLVLPCRYCCLSNLLWSGSFTIRVCYCLMVSSPLINCDGCVVEVLVSCLTNWLVHQTFLVHDQVTLKSYNVWYHEPCI